MDEYGENGVAKMQWEIDAENRVLTLRGYYHIEFERLEDDQYKDYNWFHHLSGKTWVDMNALLDAFLAAYEAANIKPTKKFYLNWEAAVQKKARSDAYSKIFNLYNEKFHPNKFMISLADWFDLDEMRDALVTGEKPRRKVKA